ncbi:GNAT family N-acetyltransferase [Paenibacillus sonchi]|uniref:GNAT family N-acetyltransferase n=1 Tax=Paenibacillus sonchi TaxID=373687 RepID=A0A974SEN6_9BACL|nr:GNAT family N-acetyltransferase [Paenibacillus sonchi]MCE3199282.1 GNAT family N-acetyltransferase [Paenibacillus sonchi]QQZ63718.1 GNAT family N-acetyltransferase [Paenibacillus sonchi]
MLSILIAEPQDAGLLAEVQKRTFDEDARRFQNKAEDGPPGYSSSSWQSEMMEKGLYYKLLADEHIIGGMIIFPSPGGEEYHLGRIFIDPLYQNRGYGQDVFHFLFSTFPNAHKWTLDTPSWAVRNHYFYEKLGFVQTAEVQIEESGITLIQYERTEQHSG